MNTQQTFGRIFSSSNNKYPTIGKFFLSDSNSNSNSNQASNTKPTSDLSNGPTDKQENDDLDLLDQLVSQTLINRGSSDLSAQTTVSQQAVSGRAKELLPNLNQNLVDQENQGVEQQAEQQTEQQEQSENLIASETAPTPEMAELSKELAEVSKETKEQREQALIAEKQQEINNLAAAASTPLAVSDKPVVVLPITKKSKEEARFKSTKYSVKWLLEWCEKIAKIFSGAVVYKEEVEDA